MISTTANANIEAWHLDAAWIESEFTPKKTVWDNTWEVYLNPETRTPVITLAKQEARKGYEPPLRQLIQMMEHNPRISVEDLKAMGIAIPDHTNTPAPVATTYPVYTIDSSVIRFLKLHFHDQNSLHKGKPRGQHGAEIRWAILTAPPANVNDLTRSAFDTSSPFSLEFDEADRGKTVYFCMRWENTRGEKGPWGEILFAIIP
ncbi:MAG: hypothetical protein LBT78_09955 [Tannerella sp.]|nr:hypothetical protein [Tannerella sp.]